MIHAQECQMRLYDTIIFQYSTNKGITLFGETDVRDVATELHQIHAIKTVEPMAPEIMAREQR